MPWAVAGSTDPTCSAKAPSVVGAARDPIRPVPEPSGAAGDALGTSGSMSRRPTVRARESDTPPGGSSALVCAQYSATPPRTSPVRTLPFVVVSAIDVTPPHRNGWWTSRRSALSSTASAAVASVHSTASRIRRTDWSGSPTTSPIAVSHDAAAAGG